MLYRYLLAHEEHAARFSPEGDTVIAILLGFLAPLCILLLWGLIEPYFIDTQEKEGPIPRLPAAWQGARVALIGDFQVGMWLHNTPTIRRVVRRIIAERPACVLIAGDFIYDRRTAIPEVVQLTKPLIDAGLPTYAVFGNHDYAQPTKDDPPDKQLAQDLREALESVGVKVMHNEVVALALPSASDDDPLYLVGVGAHTPGEDNPALALAGLDQDAPRLVLMHHPSSFAAFPAHSAPLAVAGHTHGGQISLPKAPGWGLLTRIQEGEVYDDDWITSHANAGNSLYVNRGIGFSLAPLRIFCMPELTYFTLKRAPDDKKA